MLSFGNEVSNGRVVVHRSQFVFNVNDLIRYLLEGLRDFVHKLAIHGEVVVGCP